jgi:hypothetical protein
VWIVGDDVILNISQGQRGADESLMLETAVRPQEFFLLFVYALFLFWYLS